MFDKISKDRKTPLEFYIGYGNFLIRCGKLRVAMDAYSHCFRLGGMNHDKLKQLTNALIENILIRSCQVKIKSGFCCCFCQGVLVGPITIPCGHTLCRTCIKGKYGSCPACPRGGLRVTSTTPMEINIKVQDLVEKWWPNELASAKLTEEGNNLMKNNNFELALNKYDEAISYAPENHVARDARAIALQHLNRFQDAIYDANIAVRLRPLWPKGYHTQGIVLLSLGRYEEAIIAFAVALSLSYYPEHIQPEMNRALYRIMSGPPVRARCFSLSIPAPYSLSSRLRRSRFITLSYPTLDSGDNEDISEDDLIQVGVQRFSNISSSTIPENVKLRNLLDRIIFKLNKLKNSEVTPLFLHVDPKNVSPVDFECILCCRVIWQPVTTPCGHTYCWTCLDRSLDYSQTCPLCVKPLSEYMTHNQKYVTEFLEFSLQKLLPKEYAFREATHVKEFSDLIQTGSEGQPRIPIFVCTTAFPHVPCPLFVYEPRYRVMVRRCIETGTKQFGMATCISTTCVPKRYADIGTVLEIRDCVLLSDGCSILSTVGCKRFRVLTREERDGYDTAIIEYLVDEPVPPENIERVKELHERVRHKGNYWFNALSAVIQKEVTQIFGLMPDIEQDWIGSANGPAWTWFLISILPIGTKLQLGILGTTSLEKRLLAIDKVLDHINISDYNGAHHIYEKPDQSTSSYMPMNPLPSSEAWRIRPEQSAVAAMLLEGAS